MMAWTDSGGGLPARSSLAEHPEVGLHLLNPLPPAPPREGGEAGGAAQQQRQRARLGRLPVRGVVDSDVETAGVVRPVPAVGHAQVQAGGAGGDDDLLDVAEAVTAVADEEALFQGW